MIWMDTVSQSDIETCRIGNTRQKNMKWPHNIEE